MKRSIPVVPMKEKTNCNLVVAEITLCYPIGQCKMKTVDCRPVGKMPTEGKCRLQTRGKMQTPLLFPLSSADC